MMANTFHIPKAAALGMLAAGVVYGVLSVWPLLHSVPTIPVANGNFAPGSLVKPADVDWIAPQKISALQAQGYLSVPVTKGEALSPAMFHGVPQGHKGILVSIPGSSPVEGPGGLVDVFVVDSRGKLWNSGPVEVYKASSSGGIMATGGSPLVVEMTLAQAMRYEITSIHGTVSVVGISL